MILVTPRWWPVSWLFRILHRAIVKQRDKPKMVCRKVTGSMKPFVSLYRWHITAAAIQLDLRKTVSLPAVIDVLEA